MYRGLPDCHCAQPPMFLPSPREVPSGTPVILSSSNPNAVIYYTIDGWTPTESSAQYHDPIVVTANMRIQAFAEEPGKAPSPIVAASYTISGTADAASGGCFCLRFDGDEGYADSFADR